MYQILQVTAEYSNAVLVAVMPYVSDFTTRLNLPTVKPVTVAQVQKFNCSWRSDEIGGMVRLTNGWEFSFLDGRVGRFQTPQCYYYLQDPDALPAMYGKVLINQSQAVEVARQVIGKLGYSEKALYADKPPIVIPPPHVGTNTIPRYRVKWMEPWAEKNDMPTVDLEIDGRNGQVQMLMLNGTNTFRPQPQVAVKAPLAKMQPQNRPTGRGRKIDSVSGSYSNAFLLAILPQLSEYVARGGFSLPLPITTNQIDYKQSVCGIIEGDPYASVYLKNDARLVYSHGQVIAYYATNVMQRPDRATSWEACLRCVGPVNITSNDAVALVRQTLKRLGYSEKILRVDGPPTDVGEPAKYHNSFIARYFVLWADSENGTTFVSAEVDAAAKKLTSLYINDHANANIWRKPPKIKVPSTTTEAIAPPPKTSLPAPASPPPNQSKSK